MDRIIQRELAVKVLYAMDLQNNFSEKIFNNIIENEGFEIDKMPFTCELVNGFKDNYFKINFIIEENSENYPMSKLPQIDISIIRIALTEIYILNQPHQVAINEAVEISKKYSDELNYKFINSFLGNIVRADNA